MPLIVLPFFTIPVDTAVPMYAGIESTGIELLLGEVVHALPHVGGLEPGVSTKPLKANGVPPASGFCVAHCAPQNVTVKDAPAAGLSPRVKMPRLGNGNTITLFSAKP